MNSRLRPILDDLRVRLKALYGERLAHLVLFGSHARGDADFGSDIDVLVVLRGEVSPYREIVRTSEVMSDLSLSHGVVIAGAFMDEDRYLHRQGPLLRNVRREGVPI